MSAWIGNEQELLELDPDEVEHLRKTKRLLGVITKAGMTNAEVRRGTIEAMIEAAAILRGTDAR